MAQKVAELGALGRPPPGDPGAATPARCLTPHREGRAASTRGERSTDLRNLKFKGKVQWLLICGTKSYLSLVSFCFVLEFRKHCVCAVFVTVSGSAGFIESDLDRSLIRATLVVAWGRRSKRTCIGPVRSCTLF